MNPSETIDLLSLIATFDQRTVGEADVAAWQAIALECGWTFPLARRAVLDYHKSGGDKPRIKPGHITDTLTEVRATIRRQVFSRDLVPPRELGDNPRAELDWRRRHIADVTERALTAWAEGRQLPQLDAAPAEPAPRGRERVEAIVGGRFRMPREDP